MYIHINISRVAHGKEREARWDNQPFLTPIKRRSLFDEDCEIPSERSPETPSFKGPEDELLRCELIQWQGSKKTLT